MFRFSKPNGESFNQDYMGPIFAFDSGNDLVAICKGDDGWLEEQIKLGNIVDHGGMYEVVNEEIQLDPAVANPIIETDWSIVRKMRGTKKRLFKQALATAFQAMILCEKFCND